MSIEGPTLLEGLRMNLPPRPNFYILPPEPGSRPAPVRSFRVVSSQGILETIIEGHGLSLDRAIAAETQYFAPDEVFDEPSPPEPYDLTFIENGLVVAVVRNQDDGKGGFTVLCPSERGA